MQSPLGFHRFPFPMRTSKEKTILKAIAGVYAGRLLACLGYQVGKKDLSPHGLNATKLSVVQYDRYPKQLKCTDGILSCCNGVKKPPCCAAGWDSFKQKPVVFPPPPERGFPTVRLFLLYYSSPETSPAGVSVFPNIALRFLEIMRKSTPAMAARAMKPIARPL